MAAKYDHIDFTPPAGVREEAAKGLAWRDEYGRGGTEVGIARGRDLSNGVNISPETARRMKAYFDRHEVDKQGEGWSPGENGFPSNGRIAWALWGGDAGYAWSRKLVEQMNAADEENRSMNIERRALAIDEVESAVPLLTVERRCDDGDSHEREWIVGYAAKFNTNSLEIEGRFIERITPEAFGIVAERRGRKKALETRALWNHDPNFPLARYPETLKLKVDDVGLRYEFPVPDTSYGRDLASNIRAGIVRGSSFSFQVAKGGESWTTENGRSLRVISAVENLLDVGPVTYPAYPDADAKVAQRSFDAWQSEKEAACLRRSDARSRVHGYREYLQQRGFCPTGPGGGIDNSCSSKGGGGGGGGGGVGGGGGGGALASALVGSQLGAKADRDAVKELIGDGPVDTGLDNAQRLARIQEKMREEGQPKAAQMMQEMWQEKIRSGQTYDSDKLGEKADREAVKELVGDGPVDTGLANAQRLTRIQEKMREEGQPKAAQMMQEMWQAKVRAGQTYDSDKQSPPKAKAEKPAKADQDAVKELVGDGPVDTGLANAQRLTRIQAKMRAEGQAQAAQMMQEMWQEKIRSGQTYDSDKQPPKQSGKGSAKKSRK